MSPVLAAVIGVPIVMAIGLMLIFYWNKERSNGEEGADVPEEEG